MTNELHIAPFMGLVMHLAGTPEAIKQFESDTGKRLGTSPIDKMIDESTGYDKEVCKAFLNWVADNHYGREYSPDIDELTNKPLRVE